MAGASGPYRRLLKWATDSGLEIEVTRAASDNWSVAVSIDDPVTFTATGNGSTIDIAAEQVLDQLDTVGADVEQGTRGADA